MSNYKRKKKKLRKDGWSSNSRLHKHKKRIIPEEKSYSRKKAKKIAILAKSKPKKASWWNPRGTKDWFVWSRYEKMKDAENALRSLRTKRFTSEYYEFKIGR